ncbi:MAG: phosphate ABC transporter substrate-binding protein [Mycobacterium leprae]
MRRIALVIVFMALVLAAGCSRPTDRLQVAGSTSVQPLAEILAEAYERSGGGRVLVQGGGSTAGIFAVQNGIAELGATSRSLTADESAGGLVEHIIGYDLLSVVVHPSNPVDHLSLKQLRLLFSGAVTDWAAVGGTPGKVHLISREDGSGSRDSFRTIVGPINRQVIVLNSGGMIRMVVRGNPQAIGYVSLSVARRGGVKQVAVEGKQPGEPGYPLLRPISFVTLGQPKGRAEAFLRFVRGPGGQELIRSYGLLPAEG